MRANGHGDPHVRGRDADAKRPRDRCEAGSDAGRPSGRRTAVENGGRDVLVVRRVQQAAFHAPRGHAV